MSKNELLQMISRHLMLPTVRQQQQQQQQSINLHERQRERSKWSVMSYNWHRCSNYAVSSFYSLQCHRSVAHKETVSTRESMPPRTVIDVSVSNMEHGTVSSQCSLSCHQSKIRWARTQINWRLALIWWQFVKLSLRPLDSPCQLQWHPFCQQVSNSCTY